MKNKTIKMIKTKQRKSSKTKNRKMEFFFFSKNKQNKT